MFDATVCHDAGEGDVRLCVIKIGASAMRNVFEIVGNTEADRQTPMFGRGRLDHIGFEATSHEACDTIRDRLIAHDAPDGFVTDSAPPSASSFATPVAWEGEVCLHNPTATPADLKPPRTAAVGYRRVR